MMHRHHHRAIASPGTIIYLQDGLRPMGGRSFMRPQRREPWIVEAWLNRQCVGGTRGHYAAVYARGGHLAIVRSLRTNRRTTVADWLIEMSIEVAGEHRSEHL